MTTLDLFRLGDVYLDYAFEDMKFRFEKATSRVFVHFYDNNEVEVDHSNAHFKEAISCAKVITREEYFSDVKPA